ncbi:MAG: hypothetical protein HYU88_04175 [Chloroflexi bacterium]|nr:hypothetical protein [Chloroflexota bacterium]MBI4506713.1 hypothetical protein [Chloroflexota bacterium]
MTTLVLERPVGASRLTTWRGRLPLPPTWVREVLAWHGLNDDAPATDAEGPAAWAHPRATESAWAFETLVWHGVAT